MHRSLSHDEAQMHRHIRHGSTLALGAALALASACSKAPEPKYAKDGDTGAAAPATQQTLSPNPQMGDTAGRAVDSAAKASGVAPGQPKPGTKRP
jgi:hypothetical protein